MEEPTGVGGDALLSTVVNHVAGREGPVEAAELEMIFSIISSLQGRVSPEAMMMANAKLTALRTAQEILPEQHAQPENRAEMIPLEATSAEHMLAEDTLAEHTLAEVIPASDTAPEPAQVEAIAFEHVASAFGLEASGEASMVEVAETPVKADAETLASWPEPEMDREALPEPDHAPIMLSSACPEAVAATCSPERLVALANCPHPSERLCSMIVSRGHAEALVAILRNPEARFAKSSLTTMVELAASDMSLREAMCARADLTDMILDRLWPYLSLSSRAAVMAAGCDTSYAEALVICADAAAEEACEISEDDSLRSVADWCGAVRNREESLSHAMRSLDQEGRIVDVAAMLAEF
ncbi:MAG: DUF2336 domain-containing protein, partial [Bosea sp. (in: a-proteobacteria)]